MDEMEKLKNNLKMMEAEKLAIDQVAGSAIRENIQLRTQLILIQNEIAEKDNKITELNKKISELENLEIPVTL